MTDPAPTPFQLLGGEEAVQQLAEAFYDAIDAHEPALAQLHPLGPDGKVSAGTRERFGLFLVGWLGGPAHYSARHGHPRLRMRHAHLPVDAAMRDAWVRSMRRAMDARGITGEVRTFLEARFSEVAEFLRNAD